MKSSTAKKQPKTKAKAPKPATASMHKRVLLVEDDPFISKAYALFIAKSGFTVDAALNVLEARKKMAAHKPDIILLDVIMPGINGLEFLEELNKKALVKEIPVIMVSNLSEESTIAKCKRLGAVDYLVKSNFFMSDVIDKIEAHLIMTGFNTDTR